jgi:ATP-binding cassette subfamily F protein uup
VVNLPAGNYDYFLEKRPPPSALVEPVAAPKAAPARRERARKLSYKETKELEGIEGVILAAEEELVRLETGYDDPAFYTKLLHEQQAWAAKIAASKVEIPRLYARWEELEQIKAAQ